ncbi:enoyl-CoA hydratase/carnithine racemase [Cryobacterium mesophilum]|uniref:Enoyl-CoA hydratase/isomerase family protein n=1 Tax=Terrimesophilobacter mesophilus TaxID=433647 RepID=A0A4R8VGL5_9MICO|nr:enoyl-CoA hydratase/isomerase family protein [Terrimesophilobacter mesophilus]MBB5634042.1 enoyl-CoA hydratase/carnithine racemase [Terrimesophilobacter mesophilus]TFB81390.1 enoyl-CoA hydratase/isomerase family protein [Terrimesophilobacter mesophilus]
MIDLQIADNVAELTLNIPDKLNALDDAALAELGARLQEAAAASPRALLLRGEGRAFCAGRDISAVDPATDDALAFLQDSFGPVMRALADFPAPTFAAAHGACLGIGLGLLIATDVVYVAEGAKLGSPFANLGATLDSGGHALFFERLGAHRALDLIYTAELMSGTGAVAAGLFSRAIPDAELLEFARAKAATAASGATQAFLASKKLIARLRDERVGLWESVAEENVAQERLRMTADYREGFAAFQQKRKAMFAGE